MSYIRTFIAVDLHESVRRRAGDLVRRWSGLSARINWVDVQNMHVTLKFLGDVEDREIPAVCTTVQQVAARHRSFPVECRGAGAFPAADRARTLWLGVTEGEDALTSLAGDLDDALHEIGYPAESRRFHGHVTIGRVRDPRGQRQELQSCLESAADFVAGTTQVREVVVYSSVLERRGPEYGVLSRARLS